MQILPTAVKGLPDCPAFVKVNSVVPETRQCTRLNGTLTIIYLRFRAAAVAYLENVANRHLL
eukprot:12917490-Prorocentrum_lima.AAC.1